MNRIFFFGGLSAMTGLLAVFSGAGCNAIVSAGDYHVEPIDASGGDVATVDDRALPDTYVAADAGDEDATPPPGDAGGKCGDGLPKNDPAFKTLLTACLLQAGCDWLTPNLSISQCLTYNALKAFQAEAPLLTATKCSDVQRLTGRGYTSTECNGLPDGYQCSGTKSVYCKQGGSYGYQDCAIIGGTCGKYQLATGDGGTETVSDCMVASSCGGGDGATGCSNTTSAYTCEQNRGFGQVCTPGITVCNPSTGGCNFVGDSCTSAGDTCQSGKIVSCLSGAGVPNMSYTFDCTTAGLACTPESATSAWCVAPNCTVAEAKGCKEKCKDGTTATFCVGGAPMDVDCTQAGFTSCEMRGTSSDRAQCR